MVDQIRIVGRDDPTYSRPARVDERGGGLVAIDTVVDSAHRGFMWTLDKLVAGVADGAAIELLMTGVSGLPHIQFLGISGGTCTVELFENPTVGALGTLLTPHNRRREATDVCPVTFYGDPTITDAGTILQTQLQPGGTKGRTVGTSGSFQAWILQPGDTYLLRLTNNAGNTQPCQLEVDIWTHSGVD